MALSRDRRTPLLRLSDARIARELQDVRVQDEADRRWRRIATRAVLKVLAWYVFGLFLMGSALHTTNYELAGYLYVAGVFVYALGPAMTAVRFLMVEGY